MEKIPLVQLDENHNSEKYVVPPPEIGLQSQVAERIEVMKGSANRYSWIMADWLKDSTEPSDECLAEMLVNQKNELPLLISAVLERTCNLQCDHCLYQEEKSSANISTANQLNEVITNIVSQVPESYGKSSTFMSAGRILRPEHLELFQKLKNIRPDLNYNVIDNGTYTQLLPKWPEGFVFDVMDISIDGTREHHNKQRQSPRAYDQAVKGLEHAREVANRVTSLLTLTNINAKDIESVADTLLNPDGGKSPLVDQLNITTLSPTNSLNAPLETTKDDFKEAWESLKRVSQKYVEVATENSASASSKVKLNIYRVPDIEKLAYAIGESRFLQLFTENNKNVLDVMTGRNFIFFNIDGVEVTYQPLSIWTPEEFLIEADGAYRTAYEGQFTLAELRSGQAQDGRSTRDYTIEQLSPESDFKTTYEKGVDEYWVRFGKKRLREEMDAFRRIKERAMLS